MTAFFSQGCNNSLGNIFGLRKLNGHMAFPDCQHAASVFFGISEDAELHDILR
ncbi:hypothetical protein DSUL_90081 [Desulfovibrionales bacterium]